MPNYNHLKGKIFRHEYSGALFEYLHTESSGNPCFRNLTEGTVETMHPDGLSKLDPLTLRKCWDMGDFRGCTFVDDQGEYTVHGFSGGRGDPELIVKRSGQTQFERHFASYTNMHTNDRLIKSPKSFAIMSRNLRTAQRVAAQKPRRLA